MGKYGARRGTRRLNRPSRVWWTRPRVIAGGQKFYADFEILPTDIRDYQAKQQFTGRLINGRPSNQGHHAKYPSSYAILKFFDSMRDFWRACGFKVNRGHEDWTADEDAFITETVGLYPREEVAAVMGRTAPSIKRRLYDLRRAGKFDANARNRWGWSLSHAAEVLDLPQWVLRGYIDRGELPIFRGNKCIFVEPCDLVVIREYNWARKRQPKELDRAVRRGLALRLCYAVLGYDWRAHSMFQPAPKEKKRAYRRRKPKTAPPRPRRPLPPCPPGFRVRRRVRIKGDAAGAHVVPGRIGTVEHIHWVPGGRVGGTAPTRPGYWAARVSFPKLIAVGSDAKRVSYSFPLTDLEPVEPGARLKPQKARRRVRQPPKPTAAARRRATAA